MKVFSLLLLISASVLGQIQGDDQFVIMSHQNVIDTAFVLLEGTELVTCYETVTGLPPEETKDIAKVKSHIGDCDSSPDLGGLCEKNKFYRYLYDTVFCRQTHNRTIYTPYETPALFSFARYDNGSLIWIENEYVYVDSTRYYDDTAYTVLQEHLTDSTWLPTLTLGVLWKLKPVEVDCNTATEWLASDSWTTYSVGDRRLNDGSLWEVTSVSYTYYEPSGTYGYLSWIKIQDCD